MAKYNSIVHARAYKSWAAMKARCRSNHPDYGGRGITFCERWNRFENFLADLGDPPEGMTLDRIDVNGNYEPNNCRWATPKQQIKNRRPGKKRFHQRPDVGVRRGIYKNYRSNNPNQGDLF